MFSGITAVISHYERAGFSGALRFAISMKNDVRNVDLCEDSTIPESENKIPMAHLKELCNRIKFGWIQVYLVNGVANGLEYKINYQGCDYRNFEAECQRECRSVKVVVRKSNT